MAQTNTTTLATALPNEFLIQPVIAEARAANVIGPLVTNDVLPQGKGKVWEKQKLPSTAAASVAEGSDITPGARTTTSAQITVAEVGLGTEVTDFARETTTTVVADLMTWAASQGRAIGEHITSALGDLFAALNGSTAVGTSGTNITVANFVEALYTLENANAPGRKVAVLHPRQVVDLFNAMSTSTGTPFGSLTELVRQGRLPGGIPENGLVGELFGVPIYQTTECPTANSAADRVGAMFVKDALGFIQLRPIRTEYDRDASKRSTEVIVTAAYGVGEIVDAYGVSIVTDA